MFDRREGWKWFPRFPSAEVSPHSGKVRRLEKGECEEGGFFCCVPGVSWNRRCLKLNSFCWYSLPSLVSIFTNTPQFVIQFHANLLELELLLAITIIRPESTYLANANEH